MNPFFNNQRNSSSSSIRSHKPIVLLNTPEIPQTDGIADVGANDFKNALLLAATPEKQTENTSIPPGCVEISQVNGQFVYQYGPPSNYSLRLKAQQDNENDPNYMMHLVVRNLQKLWEKREQEYDEIQGHSAYQRRFRSDGGGGNDGNNGSGSEEEEEEEEEENL